MISEFRVGGVTYDLAYTYDQVGNRLMKYEIWDINTGMQQMSSSGSEILTRSLGRSSKSRFAGSGPTATLLSTVYNYYNDSGNIDHVVTHPNLTNDYFATRFGYAANENVVSFAMGKTWEWDGDPLNDPTTPVVTWAREFRYDEARQRYLDRALEPAPLMATGARVALSSVWTDYDGNQPYGDHDYVDGNFVESTSYQPGLARVSDPLETLGTPVTVYYHGDMLGTTRHMTNSGGNVINSAAYTAFGELKSGTNHRYGYVGEYGYQQHAEMPFMHVGHRYYDPGSGRFLQRDPIGIDGGLNVYAYVAGKPTVLLDPNGLDPGSYFLQRIQDERRPKPPPKPKPRPKPKPIDVIDLVKRVIEAVAKLFAACVPGPADVTGYGESLLNPGGPA